MCHILTTVLRRWVLISNLNLGLRCESKVTDEGGAMKGSVSIGLVLDLHGGASEEEQISKAWSWRGNRSW